jgi:hypothetical protein
LTIKQLSIRIKLNLNEVIMFEKGIYALFFLIGLYYMIGVTCFSTDENIVWLRDFVGVEEKCSIVLKNKL